MVATANILIIQGKAHCAFGAHLYTCMASGESTEYAVAVTHEQKSCCTKSRLRQNQSHCLFRQTDMIALLTWLLTFSSAGICSLNVTEQTHVSSSSQMSSSKKLKSQASDTAGSPIRRLACT